ncbi:MAG: MFS transporter [Betaproteobacteria bacterium]|nr:MFS transporter [Betaproteobacteria bacterium]
MEQALKTDIRTISLVSLAHGLSHFFQIATAVVFPLIKDDLGVTYVELGGTVALYYTVSGICQTAAGFAVDRFGARRVLFFGLLLSTAGALIAGLSQSYAMLVTAAVVGGIGNSVFHPCDLSILNARVHRERLGYAFSGHGLAGYLGYALAPIYGITMAAAAGWRGALLGAAALGALVIVVLAVFRDEIHVAPADGRHGGAQSGLMADIRILASLPVLMCFGYFILASVAFIATQNFGVVTFMALYGVSAVFASAALTSYLLGGAAGILAGGFVAVRTSRQDIVAVGGMAVSALLMFTIASTWFVPAFLPLLCAAAGFFTGMTGPSRDLIVRATAPPGSTGKVYGFVYSGLDVGSMVTPLYFGWLLDGGRPSVVIYTVVVTAILTIATVLNLPGNREPAKG